MAKANGKKGGSIDKDEEVMSGKRKRTVPKKFESPYALDKPGRRTSRGQRTSGTSTATRGIVTNILNFLLSTNAYDHHCLRSYYFMQLYFRTIMCRRLWQMS